MVRKTFDSGVIDIIMKLLVKGKKEDYENRKATMNLSFSMQLPHKSDKVAIKHKILQ